MQNNLDANKIKAKEKEIHELRGQLQEKRTDSRLNFYNILTPEQRAQFIPRNTPRAATVFEDQEEACMALPMVETQAWALVLD